MKDEQGGGAIEVHHRGTENTENSLSPLCLCGEIFGLSTVHRPPPTFILHPSAFILRKETSPAHRSPTTRPSFRGSVRSSRGCRSRRARARIDRTAPARAPAPRRFRSSGDVRARSTRRE